MATPTETMQRNWSSSPLKVLEDFCSGFRGLGFEFRVYKALALELRSKEKT